MEDRDPESAAIYDFDRDTLTTSYAGHRSNFLHAIGYKKMTMLMLLFCE